MNAAESSSLGTEKLSKLMLKYSIPCVLSLLVSALYNIVDQIFIGNSELSTLGNAATGVVFPFFIVAQAFAWCFGDGCAAYLNLCLGKKDMQSADKAIGTGITVTCLTGLLLVVLGYLLKAPLLTLFGASENSLGMAIEYLEVILAFFPFFMLSNMMNSVIRADGSPTCSMVSMLVGAAINLVLDPLFIFGFHWGMAGAAWATVIGQFASFLICVWYFFRTRTFRLHPRSLLPDFRAFAGALKLGLSSFVTQMTILVIVLVSNRMLVRYGAVSQYGVDIPIAVMGIENKVFTVVINIVVGIVLGCQPVIGYNIGARNYARVRCLFRQILLCTTIVGVAATLLFVLAPHMVVRMFGVPTNIPNPDDYWLFAEKTFRIFLSLTTFTCIVKVSSIFFQAAGKPVRAVVASMVRDILCFIPLILLLPRFFGIEGILYAAPAADMLAMLVSGVLMIDYFRRLRNDAPAIALE